MVNVARDEYGKVLEGYLRSRLRLAPVSALLALYVPYSLPSPINTHKATLIYYINERWYVRWETHFTRELPFLKVIETHDTTQMKDNYICSHHT